MFEYFKDNYAWNLTALTLIEDVGTISQPAEAFEKAAQAVGKPAAAANYAWHKAMSELGAKTEKCAEADLAAGHPLTAGRKFHRAAMYFIRAERNIPHTDPTRLETYRRALANFRKARDHGREGVEFVDIPFEDGAMPALLVLAAPDAPIVVHIQGFDSIKETQWPCLQEYRRRGLSVLIVDQPGAGGALRLHDLHARLDAEAYVSVIIDWIEGRLDIKTGRIGLCGVSMGGYLAPRATAFEPRIKACAAWGALHDASGLAGPMLGNRHDAPSVPDVLEHSMWSFGDATPEANIAKVKQMSLTGVVDRIDVPLLVMHGENDRQAPLEQAIATYEQATTYDKTLKVFRQDEGGVEHCQIDNKAIAADYLADWFSERL